MNSPLIEQPDATSLMIRRTYDADIASVFHALTDPVALSEWFGPSRETTTTVEADLRVCGKWTISMTGPDGSENKVSGEFVEIEPPNRVVFTWAWQSTPERVSQVSYLLSPTAAHGTTLTLIHERLFDSTVRDRHGEGWAACLDGLGPFLSSQEN